MQSFVRQGYRPERAAPTRSQSLGALRHKGGPDGLNRGQRQWRRASGGVFGGGVVAVGLVRDFLRRAGGAGGVLVARGGRVGRR